MALQQVAQETGNDRFWGTGESRTSKVCDRGHRSRRSTMVEDRILKMRSMRKWRKGEVKKGICEDGRVLGCLRGTRSLLI